MPELHFTGSPTVAPLPEALLDLAPLVLPNRRRTRYQGDDVNVSISELTGRDQETLRHLYRTFTDLLARMVDPSTRDPQKWADVLAWAAGSNLHGLIDQAQEFGESTRARGWSEAMAKTLHDLRGGALSALLGRLQLLTRMPRTEGQMRMLFSLTRDHLKIMRNAVVGLDDARRDADRTPKSHHVQLILKKWHDAVVGPYPVKGSRDIRMMVDARYHGALTECCLESAAVDRIFYNLVNNACRHSAGERIEMTIFEIPSAPGDTLRFVLSNEVSDADAARLRALGGANGSEAAGGIYLDSLFLPSVSSTGSGFGLTVVADFVAGAFGLGSRAEAVRGRYTGAWLDGKVFHAFFHWPAARDDLPHKLDDYRRPDVSLSEGRAPARVA